MTRRVVALIGLAALTAGCGAEPETVTGPPTREIRVGLDEWTVTVPPVSAEPGPLTFTVTNAGAAPHDLQVSQDGRDLGRTPILSPGQTGALKVTAASGSPLRLVCTVPGHLEAGMETTLAVETAPSSPTI